MTTHEFGETWIRILIVDDHYLLRQGLKAVLSEHFECIIFGDASNAHEALDISDKEPWDVIILDVSMPGRGGLDVLRELRDRIPKVPVIILSSYPEEQMALRVLKLGAASYIQKTGIGEELVGSVEAALRGDKYITPSIAQRLALHLEHDQLGAAHDALSEREYQVMCLLAFGKTVKEVGSELSLSVKTISTYRVRILEKMRLRNNSQLMHYAMRHRLVESDV